MRVMTLHDQIAQDEARLRARRYDGLIVAIGAEVCGCGIGDLRPCGEVRTGCRPARTGEDGLFYPARKPRSR